MVQSHKKHSVLDAVKPEQLVDRLIYLSALTVEK